ncbi:MAG: tyrosine-type recombinase/integrase [Thermincola sp.]|nr:tyrosine-type recombinase/integrase [Thermincola sp.]
MGKPCDRRERNNVQKSGTLRHEKVQVNTGIIPAPKSLHILAKNASPWAPVAGAGGRDATWQQAVAAFRRHLTEDGKSAKTVESYTGDVAGFLAYLEAKGADVNGGLRRFHITSYRSHLLEAGYEAATVNKKINSLQAFNRYLLDRGELTEMVVDVKRDKVKVAAGSEREVEVYQEPLVERLLFYVQTDKVTKRDRAVILVLLYTGVRVSELCDIRVRNIDFLTGHLRVTGKGGKMREVPLKPEVVEAVREYLADRAQNPYSESEHLFLGQRGPLQRDAVNTMLEKHSVRLGLGVRLKPHAFRHTFCTRLINKGVPLTTVSKLAGHSSVDTTARYYVNSSKEDKMRAVNML